MVECMLCSVSSHAPKYLRVFIAPQRAHFAALYALHTSTELLPISLAVCIIELPIYIEYLNITKENARVVVYTQSESINTNKCADMFALHLHKAVFPK